jgi:hypothetical protein
MFPLGREPGLIEMAGGGQGFGEQLTAAPRQLLGGVQTAWLVTAHAPAGLQQAPVGWGQGFGEQVVPAPSHEPGGTHAA